MFISPECSRTLLGLSWLHLVLRFPKGAKTWDSHSKALARFLTWIPPLFSFFFPFLFLWLENIFFFFFPFLFLIGWRIFSFLFSLLFFSWLAGGSLRWHLPIPTQVLPREGGSQDEGARRERVLKSRSPQLHSPPSTSLLHPLTPLSTQGEENSSALFPHLCTLCGLALPGDQGRSTLEPSQVPFICPADTTVSVQEARWWGWSSSGWEPFQGDLFSPRVSRPYRCLRKTNMQKDCL